MPSRCTNDNLTQLSIVINLEKQQMGKRAAFLHHWVPPIRTEGRNLYRGHLLLALHGQRDEDVFTSSSE